MTSWSIITQHCLHHSTGLGYVLNSNKTRHTFLKFQRNHAEMVFIHVTRVHNFKLRMQRRTRISQPTVGLTIAAFLVPRITIGELSTITVVCIKISLRVLVYLARIQMMLIHNASWDTHQIMEAECCLLYNEFYIQHSANENASIVHDKTPYLKRIRHLQPPHTSSSISLDSLEV